MRFTAQIAEIRLYIAEKVAGIIRNGNITREIVDAVSGWPSFAKEAGVPGDQAGTIAKTLRLGMI